MVDRLSVRLCLTILPLMSAISLLALSQFLAGQSVLLGLAAVGFTYGARIAAYPAVISALFGTVKAIRSYGIIFTAWGVAGFFGPWLAGMLYDNYGDYSFALMVAASAGILSAVVAFLQLINKKTPPYF